MPKRRLKDEKITTRALFKVRNRCAYCTTENSEHTGSVHDECQCTCECFTNVSVVCGKPKRFV